VVVLLTNRYNNMIQYRNPVQVNVFPYRANNRQIEFLLMRRLPHGGGFWQGVSGGVLVGEDITLAAERELDEETGFQTEVQSLDFTYSYPVEEKDKLKYSPDVREVVEHAFVADVSGLGETTLSREHDAFKWQRFIDIDMKDLFWPENQEALRRAWEFILMRTS
jgi:8-oxo-dGTP pyrophosphatase MutT (NUDIX family)